ncbi:hypothetical protein AM500_13715 [Bacillus sp. FJAT-18017]|uniref:hypothetical protein n=1 Tax=Bacillus sp. FJAT-18017 TaxID=1705566 RepID=UPI0006AFA45A|nr:hypothetical protein [Bacillus sp. FJAT-18017]ALC90725.1 hypothetical protein AM500_13715 [Bacillus sp. FJAT-18017]
MEWKLRIPLFLLTMGTLSGLAQKYPEFFLVNSTYLIRSAFFLGLVAALYLLLEKTKINDLNVHYSIGIGLISVGILVDYILI